MKKITRLGTIALLTSFRIGRVGKDTLVFIIEDRIINYHLKYFLKIDNIDNYT